MGFLANAQLYVGGSIGFNNSVGKPHTGDERNKVMGFNFGPEVGYSLSDKMDVGAMLFLGTTKTTNLMDSDNKTVAKTNNWNFAPYVRYSLVEFGKFKVMGRASLFIGGQSGKTETTVAGTSLPTVDDPSITRMGLGVTPVLSYNLSSNFVLLADLNFLNVGFSNSKVKEGRSTTRFDLGVDTDDAFRVGALTIGFAYKF